MKISQSASPRRGEDLSQNGSTARLCLSPWPPFSPVRRGKCWPNFPGARVDLWSRPGSAPRFSYGAVDEPVRIFRRVVSALGFRALFRQVCPKSLAGRFQPKIRGSNFEGQSFCWDFGREFSRPNFPLPSRAAPPLAPPSPGHAVPTRAGAYAVRPRGYHQALAYGLALVPHYAPCTFLVSCQDASSGTGSEP